MSQVVRKFLLDIGHSVTVKVPYDAPVVSAAMQGGELFIWLVVEQDDTPVERTFLVVGTGHEIPPVPSGCFRYGHVGTVHSTDGFVWHIFEGVRYDTSN